MDRLNYYALGQEVGKEIAEALGLKHCRSLDIHIEVKEPIIVKAEFWPEVDGIKQWPAILKKFRLVEIKEGNLENNGG